MKINCLLKPFFIYKNTGPHSYIKEITPLLLEEGIKVSLNDLKNIEDYDIIHVHDIFPYSFILKRLTKIPMITTTHATPSIMRGTAPVFLDRYWKFYMRNFYNLFDKVITISPHSMREIKSIGVKEEKIEYLMHGINLERFKPDKKKRNNFRKRIGIGKNETVIFNVARVEPRKGVFDFVKIAGHFPEHKFIWFGVLPNVLKPSYFKIKELIKNKPQNVIFMGKIADITNAYNAGDIFLFPSVGESFGLVVVEAAACGKPVILRNLEDFKIFDFPIRYESEEDCIKKIKMLLDKKTYNHYSNLTLKKIKRFDIKNHVKGLIKIYDSILN